MEGLDYLRFMLALIFVLGLIGILAVLARRTGLGFPITAIKSIQSRRLSVVEVTALDGRRRMVLIRRDNIEHLLLISPSSEMLIETNIPAKQVDNPTNAFRDKNRDANP